jgi:4-hydroxy-tetrahydrodipicolinate synthase
MTPIEPRGVFTALVTPFKKGELDLVSFRRLLHAQVEQGVDGFVINGTTAESPNLSFEEIKTLYEVARGETGLPLIVGTGSNSTARTIEMTRAVAAWKPAAALVVVPYYNKPPQAGLLKHFRAVAAQGGLPVILYNVPSRTVAALAPETTGELSREEGVIGIKDATGDMAVLEELKKRARPGFTLLSGDDATCVEFCARGGHGVIAVASHIIGREMKEAIARTRAGAGDAAADYGRKYGALFKWLYCEANPIPVKMALHWMGLLESPELRAPLVELDVKFHKELRTCLGELGKIKI